ncbi:MAG: hypothetical protein U9Q90_03650 [Campylobacterota bacterium]|nr:hypothetical protein [Campylobacterota bacterium]
MNGAATSVDDEWQQVLFYATEVASPNIFGAETLVADKWQWVLICATEVASPDVLRSGYE